MTACRTNAVASGLIVFFEFMKGELANGSEDAMSLLGSLQQAGGPNFFTMALLETLGADCDDVLTYSLHFASTACPAMCPGM